MIDVTTIFRKLMTTETCAMYYRNQFKRYLESCLKVTATLQVTIHQHLQTGCNVQKRSISTVTSLRDSNSWGQCWRKSRWSETRVCFCRATMPIKQMAAIEPTHQLQCPDKGRLVFHLYSTAVKGWVGCELSSRPDILTFPHHCSVWSVEQYSLGWPQQHPPLFHVGDAAVDCACSL